VYTRVVAKERHVHLEKHVIPGPYSSIEFSRFFCSCISLSDSLSLLREP
jgi:hypothetical protein